MKIRLIDIDSKIQNFSLIQNVRSAVESLSLFCQTFRRMPESCGGCPFLSYCEMVSDGEIIPLETIIKDILMPAVVEYADTKLREAEQ